MKVNGKYTEEQDNLISAGKEKEKQEEEKRRAEEAQRQKNLSRTKSMAEIAEEMGSLQDYLQNGDHWRGKWDIGK